MTSSTSQSYSHGTSAVPLLGQTIGENLDAHRGPVRSTSEALVVPLPGRPADLRRARRARSTALARGLLALGHREGRPGRHLEPEPRRVGARAVRHGQQIGAILVNINPAYRTHEVAVRARASRAAGCWSRPPSFKTSDYRAMVAEVRPTLPGARARRLPRHERLGRAARRAATRSTKTTCRARGARCSSTTRSTSSTRAARRASRRAPRSRHHNILNNGFFVGEGCRYTERDRVCIPVPFYHCFGMVLGNLACTTHGAAMVVPGPGVRPAADAARRSQAERCTSALRRAHHVHRRAGASPTSPRFDLSSLRTGIMAGSPCPVEVMKQCVSAMHMEEVTICYGMTETSPVSTQTARRRPARQAGRQRRAGAPPRRGQGRRPASPARVVRARRRPASSAPAGYSVMLGYWDDPEKHRRGHRRRPAGCTPATWPRWTTRATSTSSGASRT